MYIRATIVNDCIRFDSRLEGETPLFFYIYFYIQIFIYILADINPKN